MLIHNVFAKMDRVTMTNNWRVVAVTVLVVVVVAICVLILRKALMRAKVNYKNINADKTSYAY
jgi:hypothetical protein